MCDRALREKSSKLILFFELFAFRFVERRDTPPTCTNEALHIEIDDVSSYTVQEYVFMEIHMEIHWI